MEAVSPAARPAIIVASRCGGVGKTTTAAVLAAMGAGRRAICVDMTTREGASRLAKLLKPQDVEDISVSPKVEVTEMVIELNKLWIPFDVLGRMMREGDCVIDFGANVIQSFCQWADLGNMGEMLGFGVTAQAPILVVPVTANASALSDAREAIESFAEARIPISMCVVVFNEVMGSVESVGGGDLEWIRALEQDGFLSIVRMPRAAGSGMLAVEAEKVSFTSLPFVSPARFAHFAGADEMRAAHSVVQFSYFATVTVEAFGRCGIKDAVGSRWTQARLIEALERAQAHYTKFAGVRQTDILEKVRSAVADRTGVGIGEVVTRLRAQDRTMLVEMFPDLFARLQEEFIDAEVANRPPDARAVARGFEGLRLSGERRKRRSDGEIRGGMRRTDLQTAVQLVARGVPLTDPRATRLRRMEEIRAAYGDVVGAAIVLFLWTFRRL